MRPMADPDAAAAPEEDRGSSQTARGQARRQAILDAALRLLRERGYHGTSIHEIGALAGVTGPAVYRHFSGKSDVIAQAFRQGADRIGEATRPILVDESRSPRERLERLVEAYVTVAVDHSDVPAAYVLEARHLDAELLSPLVKRERQHRGAWQDLLIAVRPDLDPERAKIVVKMATFAVTSLCMQPHRYERDTIVALATRHVLGLLLGDGD